VLRFRPHLRPLVWGGRALADELGLALPADGAYGEAWLISDHPSHRSAAAGGGRTLRQILEQDAPGLLGGRAGSFPWLVKLIDARERLSVQVHPDDEQAARLWPGEGGKTEAWFVLSARPGSRVWAGLKQGVDERTMRRALGQGTVADCLHSFEPRSGDCLFLPAGTVHAVGGGVLMAEVQQTSDATFRLYDWGRTDAQGRPRQLHVEQALACVDWNRGAVAPARAEGYPRHGQEAAGPVDQPLVRCAFFHLDYVRDSGPFALAGGRMRVAIVLHGKGEARAGGVAEPLRPGDAVLLPAALGETWIHPHGSLGLLVASLPERVAGAERRGKSGAA
jgi:mannose-6-phosphate isomerase